VSFKDCAKYIFWRFNNKIFNICKILFSLILMTEVQPATTTPAPAKDNKKKAAKGVEVAEEAA
jgi:hypothetical protein